jgi:hypothetical protein
MTDVTDFQAAVIVFGSIYIFLCGFYFGKIAGREKEQARQFRVSKTNYDLANQRRKGGSSPR